ncbi:MAG: hypothetical protein IJQ97_02145, partial [Paludibacteraceae bacterium]|nr:hypothetical protein [Paludibacteraceae bacterium]
LMDGELDVHAMSQFEQKYTEANLGEPANTEANLGEPANTEAKLGEDKKGSLRFVRIDSDVIENLIVKEDKAAVNLTTEEEDALRYSFEGLLPKTEKTNYVVSLENVSADALPVFLTQNEWMRRMKEMSAHQQGMSFYGQMPDSYNLVVNIAHPKIQALLSDIKSATGNSLDELNQQVESLRKEQAAQKDSEAKIGEPENTEAKIGEPENTEAKIGEAQQDKRDLTKEIAALREQIKQHYAEAAKSNDKVSQLLDIAFLASGLLKGEALAKFVNRSVELL